MQGICFSQSQARYSVAYEPNPGPGRNFKEREEEKKKGTLFRYIFMKGTEENQTRER